MSLHGKYLQIAFDYGSNLLDLKKVACDSLLDLGVQGYPWYLVPRVFAIKVCSYTSLRLPLCAPRMCHFSSGRRCLGSMGHVGNSMTN